MKGFIYFLLVAVVYGEVVDIKKCENVSDDKCTINEIRITPCPNSRTTCRVYKGTDATIAFDFVPHFNTTQLKNRVLWGQVAWPELDEDACKATPCPTEAGKQQTYSNNLRIGKKLPSGYFTFRWEVFDANDEANMCCLKATVQIKKKL
ncbi:MD-2-related lipid-recognition protein-like [Pectinophora gossypiella]|nr:MD-2-related lipid-recognition protein-like [Pectinophora gossypiella]